MIQADNVIVMDIDQTLCEKKSRDKEYIDLVPLYPVLAKLVEYKAKGYYIILFSSRQMRTHEGNIGRINAHTARIVFEWLDKHNIPYDEIHFGKPWCGDNGFYVDDRAIRPREFVELSHDEILEVIEKGKV